jgi:selenocysteine lyase/cysteine desulfurase
VQYVPHGPVDVQALGCDFLVTSSYKWFGPHAGMLYGRYDLLDELFAYKVRPASNHLPGKFETGTQNHEGIAGVLGAVEYLEWLGLTFGADLADAFSGRYAGRRLRLKQGMAALHRSEVEVSQALLDVLLETPGLTLYGLKDASRLNERVPTYSFRLKGKHPHAVAEALGERGIFVWDGNYYALNVTTDLGIEDDGGMVRVGPVHYNTVEEVQRFAEELWKIAGG